MRDYLSKARASARVYNASVLAPLLTLGFLPRDARFLSANGITANLRSGKCALSPAFFSIFDIDKKQSPFKSSRFRAPPLSKLRGIRSIIVSGDSPATTKFVAEQIGADDFQAGALPPDKTEAIEKMQRQGLRAAMIGDGINDAPALAQADLGIALGSGTDIAMKAADIVLIGSSLEKIPAAFDLSNKTWRIVRQNLFWAFF